MKRRSRTFLKVFATLVALMAMSLAVFVAIGVRASDHPSAPGELGSAVPYSKLGSIVDVPGPIAVETIVGATWQVDRAGLINLDHPEAASAGLEDGLEPIEIYVHVLRHPSRGTFLVDTGVERALRDDPKNAAVRGLVAAFMRIELLEVQRDTASVIEAEGGIAGVLLTHLHYDHIAGMPDVPKGTPVYAGPGETSERFFLNAFAKSTTDRALAGHATISEWQYGSDEDGRFDGIIDVFGDASLFALWVPGHTAGSTAYLARTPAGPVLFVGDTSHTVWGWNHGVEPGKFTRDHAKNAESLARLRALVADHPSIDVRLGHQHFEAPADAISRAE
jgi:glyoxylase-like metal-dependent hydrolase (beta-lactamase superfamily II)